MTTAPQFPPPRSYDGETPYEIIDTPAGPLPRWHAIAHFIGETNALMRTRDDALAEFAAIRNDAAVLQAQVKELSAQERALKELAVKAVDALLRADSLVKRVEAFEQRQRADQERADQKRRLAQLLGDSSEQSKDPDKPQELEDQGDLPTDPAGKFLDQAEFPTGEKPQPPAVQKPIAVGLD
jgi:hypothetical protein